MKKNVGTIDQIVRIVLALVLILLTLTGVVSGVPGRIFIGVAVVIGLTAFIRFCPLYWPFKINTWEKNKK